MTDLKKIKKRIENCVLMKENGISWKVTSECSEEMLSKNIYSLIHKGKCADFTVFRENVQAEIMQREDAFKYVVKLMEAGVAVKRIESLVEEIGLETLIADYSEDEASEVLRDERIEAGYMGIYLKYYSHDGLSDEEVQLLWTGIKWFRKRRKLLTDDWIGTIGEARKIMAEPPVACGDLTGCKDIDRCMEMMAEKSDLRRLLNAMHPYGGRSLELDDGNMEEMAGSAGHLLDLWHWAGKFFSKEQLGRFLPLWMKNHAMVYDLEFLKKKADSEGVNNFVSLDFFPGRFLPTLISQKPSIYKGLWALPTPGLWNKMEGQRHKIKNTIRIPDIPLTVKYYWPAVHLMFPFSMASHFRPSLIESMKNWSYMQLPAGRKHF